MYLTQSTQTFGGDVPLVDGKDGVLRVFVQASESNDLQPSVRVRFYVDGSLVDMETISAPGSSVPTSVDEGSLSSSWNIDVPSSLVQPGLAILADVDPNDQIAESNEEDNHFPASGLPRDLDVWDTPRFNVTFVPVRQSVNNLVGNVTSSNASQFFSVTRDLFPIADDDADVHAEYVTEAPVLQNENQNGAWGTILSEMDALRVAEGSSRHYFGVVKTTYTSGVAGIGYIGRPTALGWDRQPSGAGVAAHEWGHNWRRRHAPGCGASSPDPSYPYASGKIGVYGLDVGSHSLKSPSGYYDIMGYCGPKWISDYTYEAVLEYRQTHDLQAVAAPVQPALVVWGRVEGNRLVLEPAFQVTTIPALPEAPGPYRLEGLDDGGRVLFSLSFQGRAVGDGDSLDRHFAFAIPLASIPEDRLVSLRLSGGGQPAIVSTASEGPPAAAASPEADVVIAPGGDVEVRWNPDTHPMVLIRDPGTGQVLSFARGGSVLISPQGSEIELVFSDRIRSSSVRRSVPR
jgi:hypothetical protein